jgi:hypothetical protein
VILDIRKKFNPKIKVDLVTLLLEVPMSGVLDLVSQVRNVILMNVYLDLGTPGGWDFGIGGI